MRRGEAGESVHESTTSPSSAVNALRAEMSRMGGQGWEAGCPARMNTQANATWGAPRRASGAILGRGSIMKVAGRRARNLALRPTIQSQFGIMHRQIPLLLAALASAAPLVAQKASPTAAPSLSAPLPTDPKVRIGTLPNGIRYYIRQNAKPEKRAELRLVVNAGSVLENDNQ